VSNHWNRLFGVDGIRVGIFLRFTLIFHLVSGGRRYLAAKISFNNMKGEANTGRGPTGGCEVAVFNKSGASLHLQHPSMRPQNAAYPQCCVLAAFPVNSRYWRELSCLYRRTYSIKSAAANRTGNKRQGTSCHVANVAVQAMISRFRRLQRSCLSLQAARLSVEPCRYWSRLLNPDFSREFPDLGGARCVGSEASAARPCKD